MPWINRGDITCAIGANTTLITVARAGFIVAIQRPAAGNGAVEYIGVLRWLQSLPGVSPSVDTEISSKPVWYNSTQWRLGNSAAEGRISLYVPQDSPVSRFVRVWEFVP